MCSMHEAQVPQLLASAVQALQDTALGTRDISRCADTAATESQMTSDAAARYAVHCDLDHTFIATVSQHMVQNPASKSMNAARPCAHHMTSASG